MITIRSEGGKTKPYIKEYMVDTIAELKHLPRHVATGSSAICLEDQSQYMLNGTSEWVKFEMGGSGGGGEDILFQEKTVEITENGTTEITADEGYALSKATVKVAVESTSKLPQVVDRTITEITAEDLEGATSIGGSAFFNCVSLTSVTIPNSVTSIGDSAFSYCTGLTSVTIGNGVTTIEGDAFYKCFGLTSVIIGNSVTSIGSSAFSDCDSLTSVIIPNSVITMDSSAFRSCNSLTSVRIGRGITSIDSSAFIWSNALTDIYIDAEEDSVPGAPWGAKNATVHWNTPLPTEEA